MDIVEILNYLADKYSFDENDMAMVDEVTNQLINSEEEYGESIEDDDDRYEDKEYEDYEDYEDEFEG